MDVYSSTSQSSRYLGMFFLGLCLWFLSATAVEATSISPMKLCHIAGGHSNCQVTEMNFWEAYDLYKIRQALALPTAAIETAIHVKVAVPLATFFTSLLVAPVALLVGRLGPVFSASLSLSLVFVWQLLFAIFKPLGESGVVLPFIAGWFQNILFAVLGCGIFLWLARDRWLWRFRFPSVLQQLG